MTCPKCNGTGEDWTDVPTDSGALNGEECGRCDGTGAVPDTPAFDERQGT